MGFRKAPLTAEPSCILGAFRRSQFPGIRRLWTTFPRSLGARVFSGPGEFSRGELLEQLGSHEPLGPDNLGLSGPFRMSLTSWTLRQFLVASREVISAGCRKEGSVADFTERIGTF